MSVKIMGLVWDLEMEPNEKLVLLAYADHASHDGSDIFPAVATIAKKTGYSERSIQAITRSLEEKGLLIEDGTGPKGTNKWKVGGAIFAPAKSAPVQPATEGGAEPTGEGVQPTAPEPSLTIIKPSERGSRPLDFHSMTVGEARKLPTLKMYAEATDFFPGSIIWEFVHTFITENKLTAEKIKEAAIAWAVAGYKQENVKGILEWAAFGTPDKHQVRYKQKPEKLAINPYEILAPYMETK